MDGKRFDDLSRVLGAGLTRQNVFHALAGAGAAGLAAIAGLAGLGEADAKKGKGGHAGKKGRGGGNGDNNRNKGNDGGGGASAEGKHKKGKGKGKNKKKGKNRQSDSVQASSDKLCPGNQDKVCHCPPGNTGNCQTTGNGGGHGDHDPLDCCCTINGQPNAECECPDGLDLPCCKPLDTACANDSQCCEGVCCDKDSAGIGTCQEECCVSKTCADFEGQCGTFPNGCGGDLECNCPAGQGCCDNQCFEGGNECCVDGDCDDIVCQVADCDNGDCKYTDVPDNQQGPLCDGQSEFCCNGDDCCVSPEICTGNGCCLPKTCADFPGQCGTIPRGCGLPDLNCGCGQDEDCCGGVCITEEQCCETEECQPRLCQNPECVDHNCDYTPVNDNQQGPLCDEQGEFCCGGDECCTSPEICTGSGCCTPLTCADFEGECGTFDNLCGGTVTCSCPQGQGCCSGQCFEGGLECCADGDCDAVICQVADCDNGDCTYTAVPDNEQGPLCTGVDQFCCSGDECCTEPQVCFGEGCCTPLTCAAYDGQCGTFTDNCGGTVTCGCDAGEQCCVAAKICVADDACCPGIACDEVLCQVADCVGTECNYTPVNDNEQGPLCDEQGEFCCGGDECCESPEICTGNGCCTPLTCAADYPGECGQRDDGCGGVLNCSCAEGQGCCEGTCVDGLQCCESSDCDALVCREVECDQGECEYTPVEDGQQGPLCTDVGDFCCNGEECCEAGDVCTGEGCCTPLTCADFPGQCGPQDNGCGGQTADCTCPVPGDTCVQGACVGCIPETKEEACADAGRVCGLVSDGCGGEYDCGACSATQTCIAGVCLARGGKRCKGTGKAGHPCKGKKCKCKAGRRCHNRKCCEPKGDGSVHCNANSDCCPGLTCLRRQPGQHKVCVRRGASAASVAPTATPGLALGAILTGLLAKGASRFIGAANSDAQIALDDLGVAGEQAEA